MFSWFPFIIGRRLWCCIMKMLVKFPRFKPYNDWFDFFSSVILVGFPNSLDKISTFIQEWKVHYIMVPFLIVLSINKMKKIFNQNCLTRTLLLHYRNMMPKNVSCSWFPSWNCSIQKFHVIHSTLLKIELGR